jgi:eukaryotic-like serine/threonine-protein kinase
MTKFDARGILGSADYLSPEQAVNSHDVDIRTDIYSLGAVFYSLLAGRPPFAGASTSQKILGHRSKPPHPIRDLRPDMPAELAAVLEKMMAKNRALRYQTPADVADALRPWSRAPKAAPPPPRPRFTVLAAFGRWLAAMRGKRPR